MKVPLKYHKKARKKENKTWTLKAKVLEKLKNLIGEIGEEGMSDEEIKEDEGR